MPYASDILAVLTHFHAPGARDLSPEARRAFAEACVADDPMLRLSRGARAAGLEMHPHRISLRALSVGPPALPLVMHSPSHGGYVVVEAVRGGRLAVRVFGEDGPGPLLRVEPAAFAAANGLDADDEVDLFHPVVSRPLDGLRDPARGVWGRLWALMDRERRDLSVVVAYAVGVGGLSLATPLAVQSLINTVAFGTVMQPLVVLGLLLLAALAASAVLKIFELVVVELLARRIFSRTAVDFSRRLPALRRDLGPNALQALVNHFYDAVVVEKAAVALIFDGLSASLQIGVGLLLLAVYHPFLLAFDIGLILILNFVIFVLGRKAVQTAVVESKKKHAVASWLEVLAGTPAVFRSVSGQRYAHARADALVHGWLSARAEHFRILLRQQGGMLVLQAISSALLVLIGGFLVLERQLTLGQLVAAEVIMTLTVSALGKLGKLLAKFYDLLAGLDKIGKVVDLPLADLGGEHFEAKAEPMRMRIVHPTLDLEVEPRDHVAVAGGDLVDAHGLVEWVAGLRELQDGRLELDGIDARALDPGELAEQIAVLEQRELFDGTVRDNVTLGDPNVTSGRIRSALHRVGLDGLEERLADGLDTHIDRDGSPLTDSQAALLQVARTIARQPRLVVVDRLFDALPPAVRRRALDVLLEDDAPWTVVCVTDQSDILDRFPRCVTAQHGQVVA